MKKILSWINNICNKIKDIRNPKQLHVNVKENNWKLLYEASANHRNIIISPKVQHEVYKPHPNEGTYWNGKDDLIKMVMLKEYKDKYNIED